MQPSFCAADYADEVERLAASANGVKRPLASVDDLRAANDMIAHASCQLNRLYTARRNSNAGKVGQAYFDPLEARLKVIIITLRRAVSVYERRRKLREPRRRYSYEVISWDDVPMERLKPYFAPTAIEEAILQAIQMGVRELPGVRIYSESA